MHYSSKLFTKKPSSFSAFRRATTAQCHRHNHRHSISTKSNTGERSSYDRNKKAESVLESWTSGVVVVGMSLGVGYCTFVSQSNTHFAFAYSDSVEQSLESEKKWRFLFADSYRRKVFFKYEKRVRTQSPPEKVFTH